MPERAWIDARVWKALLLLALLWLLYSSLSFVLDAFIALMIASAIRPLADAGQKRRIPRAATVAAVYIVGLAIIFLVTSLLVPILVEQGHLLSLKLPEYRERIAALLNRAGRWAGASRVAPPELDQAQNLGSAVQVLARRSADVTRGIFSGTVAILLILFVAAYVAIDRRRLADGLLGLLPRSRREDAARIGFDVYEKLGGYVRGQLAVSACVALLLSVGLTLLRVDTPVVIGVAAGVLNFVPFLGSTVALLVSLLIALNHSVLSIAGVLALFAGVTFLEGKFLVPHLQGRRLALHPLAVLAAFVIGVEMAGLPGAVVAVPMLAAANVVFQEIYIGRMKRLESIAAIAALFLLALPLHGCAMRSRYDMAEIHEDAAGRGARNPVIFIHGFLGAKMVNRHTHESVWGRFINAIKRGKSDDLALPIDAPAITDNRDDLVPGALYTSIAGVKFYGALLDALQQVGGYRLGDIDDPKPGDTLFVYCYDWRRDNVESAIGLGRAIERLKERQHAPGLRFDIVAHSMGGLLAEYYLKYGAEDVLGSRPDRAPTYAGAASIARLMLVGTPLRGTMHAFPTLLGGFARAMSPEVLFTMPSLYQLLPSGGSHFVDPAGKAIDVDLYDAATWIRNRWSVFNPRVKSSRLHATPEVMSVFLQKALDRAGAFHAALERDREGGSPVPIHIFGADCIPTLDRVVLKTTTSGTLTLFDDETTHDRNGALRKAILAPGDGTVTAASLLGVDAHADDLVLARRPGHDFSSTFFFCESHGLLCANKVIQDNLFYVLFHAPAQGAAMPGVGSSAAGRR